MTTIPQAPPSERDQLPGQETLLACWTALTRASSDARVVRTATVAASVFPAWAPMNNGIALVAGDPEARTAAALELRELYTGALVNSWALWIVSPATDFDAEDRVRTVDGLQRDETTLAMRTTLRPGYQRDDRVVPISLAALLLADDRRLAPHELGAPDEIPGFTARALLHDDVAVACAFTFIHGDDCGVYAVGTRPGARRRGFGSALVEHLLADAVQRGARTASLQSTPMGQALYESLDFRAAGRYEEWTPRSEQ